ncbi:MAG: NHL repeat-containing protein [Candidatus Limnocylindrales bacterium]
MSTCTECGQDVPAGRMICACGALVAAGQAPSILATLPGSGPGLTLTPRLDLSLGSSPPGRGLAAASIDLRGLGLSATGPAARGMPYRPVFTVSTPDDGSWEMRMPLGLASLPDGGFYVIGLATPHGQARLQEFDVRGRWVRCVRDFAEGDGADELDTPAGLAADEQRNAYIVDMGLGEIKKFSPDGALLARFGREGTGDDELSSPRRLAVGPGGLMAVADAGNNRVLVWDERGQCSRVLGVNRSSGGADWLMAGEAPGEFDDPQGVALDSSGSIFVADTGNHRIQRIGASGKPELVFGMVGEGAGELMFPQAIRVARTGDVHVTDMNGSRLQKFDAEGRFVHQVLLPENAGSIEDFEIDGEGRILAALRKANMVLMFEVQ